MQLDIDEGLAGAREVRDAIAVRSSPTNAADTERRVRVGSDADADVQVVATAGAVESGLGRASGMTGVGLSPMLGALLADVAVADRSDVAEVHVTLWLPLRRRGRDDVTETLVRDVLAADAVSWWQGQRRDGRAAEHRRIAWFPQPLGAQHAAIVGLGETVLIRRRHGVATVTAGLAMRSMASEIFQAAGAGDGLLSSWLRRRLRRPGASRGPERRSEDRWAVVVEAVGPDGVVRAWATGTDVVSSHAQVIAAVAAGARSSPMARVPADLGGRTLLDDLSDRGALRWAVRRPESVPVR